MLDVRPYEMLLYIVKYGHVEHDPIYLFASLLQSRENRVRLQD